MLPYSENYPSQPRAQYVQQQAVGFPLGTLEAKLTQHMGNAVADETQTFLLPIA